MVAWLVPFMGYIRLAGYLLAIGVGYYVTANYYQGKIEKIEAEASRQVIKYQERAFEADAKYRDALKGFKTNLKTIQDQIKNETSKPEYLCPIPDDGIRLLNDAIRANQGSQPSK